MTSHNVETSLRIAAVGDVALGGEFIATSRPHGSSLAYPFRALEKSLEDRDILIVNLEGPIEPEGTPREGRSTLLYNEPDILDWLASFPHSVCVLANNHAMDFGSEALARTQQRLNSRGVHYVGAGANKDEANRALRLTVKGVELGVLAFTTDEAHVGSILADSSQPGSCGIPETEEASARVRALAAETDLVVVLLHWGHEYFNYPTPTQVEFARSLVDAGANIVVGHHPHVQQGCERVGQTLICYSLGNLLLPETRGANRRIQYRKSTTKQFAILHADIAPGAVLNYQLEGGRCDERYNLNPYSGSAADRFASEMEALSEPLRSTDYDSFWTEYSVRRSRELRREALSEALAKFWKTDWETLIDTISVNDVTRTFSSMVRIALRK